MTGVKLHNFCIYKMWCVALWDWQKQLVFHVFTHLHRGHCQASSCLLSVHPFSQCEVTSWLLWWPVIHQFRWLQLCSELPTDGVFTALCVPPSRQYTPPTSSTTSHTAYRCSSAWLTSGWLDSSARLACLLAIACAASYSFHVYWIFFISFAPSLLKAGAIATAHISHHTVLDWVVC